VTSSFSEARRGFVLLEAVVALAIIGLVAVALLSTTSSQLRTASKAGVLLTARSLAEDRVAAIRFLNYDDLSDLPDSLAEGRFPPPFDEFEWTAVVEEMEDEYDLFGAEVVITGRGESFPLRTLVHAPRPVLTGGVGGRGGDAAAGRGGRGGGAVSDVAPGRGGRGSDVAPGRGRGGRGGAQAGRGGRGGPGGGGFESSPEATTSPDVRSVPTPRTPGAP
jgi:prepilin-type N-terminal cleavage/methylation domain-containing protein